MPGEDLTIEGLIEKVSRLEEENRKWMRLAGINRLTELPNSLMLFQVVLPRELRKESTDPVAFSCLLLYPDELGDVNQDHGRAVGDELLKKIGKFLKEQLDEQEQLYHCDGANFAIVIPDTPDGRARRRAYGHQEPLQADQFHGRLAQVQGNDDECRHIRGRSSGQAGRDHQAIGKTVR